MVLLSSVSLFLAANTIRLELQSYGVRGYTPLRYMRNTICCVYRNNLLVLNLFVRNT